MSQPQVTNVAAHPPLQNYCVNTEGTEHPWLRDTITTEEIATLGGWNPSDGVLWVDTQNNERTLSPGEVVHLEPGHSFCKKVRFKRGLSATDRSEVELNLLRQHFSDVEVKDRWFRIPAYPLPAGWNRSHVDAAFRLSDGHPAAHPYGLFVPEGLRIGTATPTNYTEPAEQQPPFGGKWGMFSWEPAEWRAATEHIVGLHLVLWVKGFALRFAEVN